MVHLFILGLDLGLFLEKSTSGENLEYDTSRIHTTQHQNGFAQTLMQVIQLLQLILYQMVLKFVMELQEITMVRTYIYACFAENPFKIANAR
jgi:hypothetical protein